MIIARELPFGIICSIVSWWDNVSDDVNVFSDNADYNEDIISRNVLFFMIN